MELRRFTCVAFMILGSLGFPASAERQEAVPVTPVVGQRAKSVRITVLSTMLAGNYKRGDTGEWGFAALVEVDGRRLLFDTGAKSETVLENARQLGIELSDVTELIVSHNHGDHTGGLLALRRELVKRNPNALSRAHVPAGIFQPRTTAAGVSSNGLLAIKDAYEASGGVFVIHDSPVAIVAGVWLTGPVPRINPERNYDATGRLQTASGFVTDSVPEEASLVINSERGLIVLTGCGHAGIVNVVEYARKIVTSERILAVVGGLHTFGATDTELAWTAAKLRGQGLGYLLGAHCTGIEAVYRIRQLAGLDRQSAVVAAVGSSFDVTSGIDPRVLAR